MAPLHNRVSRSELKRRVQDDPTPRITISFYVYTPIAEPQVLRDAWYEQMSALGVFGRIYMAAEGVNAQISVPAANIEAFRTLLYGFSGFDGLRLNTAVDDRKGAFYVLDIKVKARIVADGIDDPAFDMTRKGGYVDAARFNALTDDPDTLVIDMRNHYEYEVGHFQHAEEIPSDTFREQLPMAVEMLSDRKDRNIIMYCTGGIRCEKASAWMLHNGFSHVYHLEGGIINYVRQVREQGLDNRFIGKNFVFDERLGERITEDVIARCHICGTAADTHVNCAYKGCHLLFIQCNACAKELEGCCSPSCMQSHRLPESEQVVLRKGARRPHNIFNKSRSALKNLARKDAPAG